MFNIYNYTPTVGILDIYDKVLKNIIIEIKGLRANNWSCATVLNKYVETQNNNNIKVIEIYMRKNIYKLIDLNYFQSHYNSSYDYERDIKCVRTCNVNNIKNIYTYEKGKNKEEAITKALIKYGIINDKLLNQKDFKITTHYKNNRLNGKKYIKIWKKDMIIGEFWFKEPKSIDNDKTLSTWEIDLIKKI